MSLTWLDAAITALRRPSVVSHRLRLILGNVYYHRKEISWLGQLTNGPRDEVAKFDIEIKHDREFLDAVQATFQSHALYFPLPTDFMANRLGNTMFFLPTVFYVFTRLIRPLSVVETGGTPGKSSAFILRALELNGQGNLYTIDLPPPEADSREVIKVDEVHSRRPSGARPNWAVPGLLQERQTLLMGSAQEHLPRLLEKLGKIDVFIHDSDHSYHHMRWELETAYPFVKTEGYLMADDILANTAWQDFCESHNLLSHEFGQLGAVRKCDQ